MSALRGAASSHGWLAAVLPAHARRFRVGDPGLAAILAAAGAELVEQAPDVEIARAGELRGDASYAVVPLGPTLPEGNARVFRIVKRMATFTRTQAGVLRARRILRRRGYATVAVVRWDIEQVLRRAGTRDPRHRLRAVERLPGAAVLVASSRPERAGPPTVLEEAAATAAAAAGEPSFGARWPEVRGSGLLVIRGERLVLKTAVGPARDEIVRHCAALELLAAAGPPAFVADRVPRVAGHGEAGLAYWSLERRLDGDEPRTLGARLRAECLDFLVALHGIAGPAAPEDTVVEYAVTIAGVCDRTDAKALVALAGGLERKLAALPRGLGHGDFWRGNLLTTAGRLSGVVDWAAAGPGRLPLLDLVNLLTAEREPRYFGRALVEHLIPWARAGGDDASREYAERLGLDLDADRLEALVVAYWLERAARELETYGDRVERPVWLRENVELPVRTLARGDLARSV